MSSESGQHVGDDRREIVFEHPVEEDLPSKPASREGSALKSALKQGTLSEVAEQSVVSVADSSSNFGERIKAEGMEGSDEDGTQEDISLLNGDDPHNSSAEKHPEDIRHDDVVQVGRNFV
uniref:Uncharacterized protein n=1 Tax=Parascaris equorum TaxID=6256 RepID=A0A914RH83_PAREQ